MKTPILVPSSPVRLVAVIALLGAALSGCGGADPAPVESASPSVVQTPSPSPSQTPTSSPADPSKVPAAPDLKLGWPATGPKSGATISPGKVSGRQLIALGCRLQTLSAPASFTGEALEYLGPEDLRKRQLARFSSPADAQAAVAVVADEARSCLTRDQDGAKAISDIRPRADGIQITTYYTYEGEVAAGASSLVAVRKDSVVVLSSMATEAAGAEGARTLAEIDLPHARTILAQACAAKAC